MVDFVVHPNAQPQSINSGTVGSSVTVNTLAEAANLAYSGGPVGNGWTTLEIPSSLQADMNKYNYSAQAFLNTETGELIIANRGTQPSSFANDYTDAQLAMHNGINTQIVVQQFAYDAYQAANQSMNDNGGQITAIYTVGHSLGGAESQIQAGYLSSLTDPDGNYLFGNGNISLTNVSFNSPGLGSALIEYNNQNYNSFNIVTQGDLIHSYGGNYLDGTIVSTLAVGPVGGYYAYMAHSMDLEESGLAGSALGEIQADNLGLYSNSQLQKLASTPVNSVYFDPNFMGVPPTTFSVPLSQTQLYDASSFSLSAPQSIDSQSKLNQAFQLFDNQNNSVINTNDGTGGLLSAQQYLDLQPSTNNLVGSNSGGINSSTINTNSVDQQGPYNFTPDYNDYTNGNAGNGSVANYGYTSTAPITYATPSTNYDFTPDDDDDDDEEPVVLDLTGSGINITQLTSSNTFFDMTGTGKKSLTAWAGAGNGVLFYDPTGTGQLTQANQVVFTDWDPTATSDMQALEDVFDTNHDGSLDAGDTDFADFYVMVTNANGTETAVSLASLGITSINLTANTVNQTLADGSSINGETTYTTASGTTRTAATVTFATSNGVYAATTTNTANADGSETVTNVALNADGSIADTRVLNTSASGLVKTLSDTNAGGVVTNLQTDVTTVSGATTTETVTNYANGAVTSTGELTTSGVTGDEKLNSRTTTTVTGTGSAKTVTIAEDQLGGGWTTENEVDTYNSAGLLTSTVVSNLNNNGSASTITTTTIASTGLTTTVTSLVDGIAADSTTSVDAISYGTATGSNPPPETEVVTDSLGTTVTSLITTNTTTTTGLVTRVITSDLTDGSTLDETTTETTTTSSSGSTTTTTDVNANGSFRDETVATVDPTGLLKTTSTDQTGAGTAAVPVFSNVNTDNTVINSNGSQTETVSTANKSGTVYEKTVTVTSADQQTTSVSRYLDETGTIGTVDQTETIQTQTNGSVVETTVSYDSTHALLGTITQTTSGNGLVTTTTYANSAGTTTDTQTNATTLNANGSKTEVFTDVGTGAGSSTITTNTSANGLVKTVTEALSTSSASFSISTSETTTLATAGGETEVTTDKIGSATSPNDTTTVTTSANGRSITTSPNDTTTVTTSANGRSITTSTDENGDGRADITDQVTIALDGSKTETTDYYSPGADALAMSLVVATSVDGRTTTSTEQSDWDGTKFNVETDVYVENANDTTTESRTASGSFGASAISQTVNVVTNTDGSQTTTTATADGFGVTFSQIVAQLSPTGLVRSFAYDTTGEETAANLKLAAADLVSGTALPSGLLVTDILESDTTTLNADGSKTEVIQTTYGNGSLRSKTMIVTSANGLITTTSIDDDGNGVYEQVDTLTIAPDGSKTEVYDYYGDTTATASTLQASSTTTTSANGLVTTVNTGTGITDTTVEFADSNGSYQFTRTVVTGSAAYNSPTIFYNVNSSSSHIIDANGIDTWSWNDGYGDIGTTVIDLTTEKHDIALANGLFQTLFGQPMDDAVTQYLGQFITNGVLDQTTLATDIIESQQYADDFGVIIVLGGTPAYLFQGFDVFAAFENALGRLPTAEEMGIFDQFMAADPSPANIAAMAIALTEYAANEGTSNNRTQLDPNQDLVSILPGWTSPASSLLQIKTAGTYADSNAFVMDYNFSTGYGVAATINGNSDIILAMMNSNITLNGYNNAVDDADATVTISTSNAALMVESGGIETITGNNNQISQVGATKVTLSSGTGDQIYIEPGAPPSVGPDYNYVYSTTNASNATITLGAGGGTSANPDLINGNTDTIDLDGTDYATITGSHNIVSALAAGNAISASGSYDTFIYKVGFGTESISGFSAASNDVISLASSEFANFAAVLSAANNSGSNVVITGSSGDALTLIGVSKSALAASEFTFHS